MRQSSTGCGADQPILCLVEELARFAIALHTTRSFCSSRLCPPTILEKQQAAGWGDAVVERLAADPRSAFPGKSGFSADNLWRARQLYTEYSSPDFLEQAVPEMARSRPAEKRERSTCAGCKPRMRRKSVAWRRKPHVSGSVDEGPMICWYQAPKGRHRGGSPVDRSLFLGWALEGTAMSPPFVGLGDLDAAGRMSIVRSGSDLRLTPPGYELLPPSGALVLSHGVTELGLNGEAEILSQPVREFLAGVPWGHHANALAKVSDPARKTNPIGVAAYQLQPTLPAELKGRIPSARQLADAVREHLPARNLPWLRKPTIARQAER